MSGKKLAFVAAPEDAKSPPEEREAFDTPTGLRRSGGGSISGAGSRRSIDLDESIDLGPDALAGTIGVAETVLHPEQIADLSAATRYTPMGPIGRGGMGRVDMVFDRALGRPVAKKTVLKKQSAALLLAEAQVGAQLEHPSIVPVYDVEVDALGKPHYTMRVVRGRTLRDVIDARRTADKGAMSTAQALGVLRQICLAVEYAHSRGVVHRDLKPENVVVGEFGEVYVLDWGVAWLSPDSDLHSSRHTSLPVAGTPGYMAPEQMCVGALDARTDVYALGVMMHEVFTGERPSDEEAVTREIGAPVKESGPGVMCTLKPLPTPFDELVYSCLQTDRAARPPNARAIADAIDAYLDGERARAERRREADVYTSEGETARETFDSLDAEAARLEAEAHRLLADRKPWEPLTAKQAGWDLAEQSARLRSEASRALARGEASFTRALGRVPDHEGARKGLAALYFRQFVAAEEKGDARKMAQYLDLARTYDDGPLSVLLKDEGLLSVYTNGVPATITVARYESRGLILAAQEVARFSSEAEAQMRLASGSYLVTATAGETVVRYPVLVKRAHSHELKLRFENAASLPNNMVLIAGGPFLTLPPRETKMVPAWLGDFAIGKFPVTFGDYVAMLDDVADEEERRRLTPEHRGVSLVVKEGSTWRLAPHAVEGEARKRIAEGRELSVPVFLVSWFQASEYIRWLAQKTGKPFRLPTDLEWEKAARGADGRMYPMGNRMDPCLAKVRESRSEAPQPEPIGAFVHDESPFGVRDLAGGIGDWTCTAADGSRLGDADDASPDSDERVAFHRGGSWGTSILSHMRYPTALRSRSPGVGFRLALDLNPARSSDLVVTPLPALLAHPVDSR
ncbi:MAG: SUMF1/EgtB/PvdO family nonheme iron enzyme [Polyangiaceae bacterium]|nr:SUMF1/EgtB/PvdO family nonheme iron enzyme [Polyangiaceae bacterium]